MGSGQQINTEELKRRTSFGSKNNDSCGVFDQKSYHHSTSIHPDLVVEYRPLEIMKVLFSVCGDPQGLSPANWTAQQVKDFNIFFDSLSQLDKITKEIFENLYCKTQLDREWFQDKNSILCQILEQFNDFFVRSIEPLGSGEFNLADLMLLGTTQRIFRFLLMQNYRENNISELTQWFTKMTQIKEFRQTFGVAKFCVGSIDDLYQFSSAAEDKSRKKRQLPKEDESDQMPKESQTVQVMFPREGSTVSTEDKLFDLENFKQKLRSYFDPNDEAAFRNNQPLKESLENFNHDVHQVFVLEADQEYLPEEGFGGFEFISKFQKSEEKYLLFMYFYQVSGKQPLADLRNSEISYHEISESEKVDQEYCESVTQSENEQDDEDDEDKVIKMTGLLICEDSEKLREIRESVMIFFTEHKGLEARIQIDKVLFKKQQILKDFLII